MALYDAGEMRIVDGHALPVIPSRYGESRRLRWPMLAAVAVLHLALASVLDLAGMLPVRRAPSELKLIQLSPEAAPPAPMVEAKLPEQMEPRPTEPPRPVPMALRLDAPPPVVSAPAVLPFTTPGLPPPPPAPVATGPVRVADLDAKALTIVPPKYPLESRRKREQGTVVLAVTLDPSGSVADLGVASSSGFDRLDRAAMDAVRRWRWSPTVRDGIAVAVKGTVDIPFILKG
jgi:periplasmic protein TonB